MKVFYVYALYIEGEDNPFYIGKTYRGAARLSKHLNEVNSGSTLLKARKMRKAICSNKKIYEKIIFETTDESDAFRKEQELIALYGRIDNKTGILTNHTDGGEGMSGTKHSEHTKQRLSELNKNNKNWKYVREKGALATRKAVILTKLDTAEVKSFDSISSAAKYINSTTGGISNVLSGKRKSIKGYHVSYLKSEVGWW